MPASYNRSRIAALLLGATAVMAAIGCARESPVLTDPIATGQCPPWALGPSGYGSNDDSPFLGCDVESNLRSMVQNPADLDRGRLLGPASGERETRAVEGYQQGKVKPFAGSGAMGPQSSTPSAGAGVAQ